MHHYAAVLSAAFILFQTPAFAEGGGPQREENKPITAVSKPKTSGELPSRLTEQLNRTVPRATTQPSNSGITLRGLRNGSDAPLADPDLSDVQPARIGSALTFPMDAQAVVQLLFEDKWDIATNAPTNKRTRLGQPIFTVIEWELIDKSKGTHRSGTMRLQKDGEVVFTAGSNTFKGRWTFSDGKLSLTLPVLNNGKPHSAPVVFVKLPHSGARSTYAEWSGFRFHPVDTRVRGQVPRSGGRDN